MPDPYPFVKVESGNETIIYREFHKSLVQLLSHLFSEYYVIVISIVYMCVCVCVFRLFYFQWVCCTKFWIYTT